MPASDSLPKQIQQSCFELVAPATLRFFYGVVGCGKTKMLLDLAEMCDNILGNVLIVKPSVDTRFGDTAVCSRSGQRRTADITLKKNELLSSRLSDKPSVVFVDEAQFLSKKSIYDIVKITVDRSVPIFCFGLRTDFLGRLFPAVSVLLACADIVTPIEKPCRKCCRPATYNMRVDESLVGVFSGPLVVLGSDDKYLGVCSVCYYKSKNNANKSRKLQSKKA